MIIMIIETATKRYALKVLFTVSQNWYRNEAITNLEAYNVEAIIITANAAPANNFDNPTIEKKAAQKANDIAINPTNIFNVFLFIRL